MYCSKTLRTLFLDYLQVHKFDYAPSALFEPVDYIMNLGGKRLRPVMLLMSYNLYQNDIKPALPAAYAYEIFHNFSLVHDDIMDEAPLRRGKPTIHQKYDINTGILSGDVMLIYAYKYLLDIEDQRLIPDVLSTFTKVATEVCIGQQYDINFETEEVVAIEDYLQMIESKTAALIAGAMYTGALLAGAPKAECEQFYEFGRNLGIAFQLQDDILDTFGDASTFGKRIGGDIVQNKKTFLVLRALQEANTTQKATLKELMSSHPKQEEEKIAQVTALFNQLNIKEIANKKKEDYHDKALEHLEAIQVQKEKKQLLMDLAASLLERIV